MKAFTFILLGVLATSLIYSQTQISQQWASRFNGTANNLDYGYAIALDPAGNIIATGFSTNTGTSKDMLTVKYDINGNMLWSRSYDGSVHGGDYSYAVVTDQSGNVYVTGRTDQGATSSDITTIKYNSAGVQQWVALYDGPANSVDEARCISVDNSGNVIVAGRSTGVSSDFDAVVIKYSSAGAQLWASRYNGPGNGFDAANSLAIDNSGNIYITGNSFGSGSGDDYFTLKYNSAGVQQWVQRYNGPANGGDFAVAVKLDGSGNVYVTGGSDGGATYYDFATIKYDANGSQQWLRRYNTVTVNTSDIATAMAVNSAGDVFVTGTTTTSLSSTDSNYATIKYNTNGDLLWSASYIGPNNASDVPRAIILDYADNVYVTGSSYIAPDLDDYATIAYSSAGNQKWLMTYNGPASSNDYSASIAVDALGNVYVTGKSNGVSTMYDIATIKYGISPTGINPLGGEIPSRFKLWQNYPNPFNPSTKIRFDIPVSSDVSIKVFNLLGEEKASLFEGYVKAGSYETGFNAADFSSGVYFYKLIAGNYTDSKKMIVIK
jgi:uncharacterized delta-60 repeat protein